MNSYSRECGQIYGVKLCDVKLLARIINANRGKGARVIVSMFSSRWSFTSHFIQVSVSGAPGVAGSLTLRLTRASALAGFLVIPVPLQLFENAFAVISLVIYNIYWCW